MTTATADRQTQKEACIEDLAKRLYNESYRRRDTRWEHALPGVKESYRKSARAWLRKWGLTDFLRDEPETVQ